MKILIDNTEINLAPEYSEYLELMRNAVVKPGEPPVPSNAEMVKRILQDNYSANIQQNAIVRPKSVAEKIKALESAAVSVFKEATEKAIA